MRYLRVQCEHIVEIEDDDLGAALENGNWECSDVLETISESLQQGLFTELTEDQVKEVRNQLE